MSGTPVDRFDAITLPAPLNRRMRLGPFPSARDALKFFGYVAVGILAATLATPSAWVPFLVAGFVLSVHKTDGKGFDDRLVDYLRWSWRTASYRRTGARAAFSGTGGGLARGPGGRRIGVLSVLGTPVAFLPPEEARRLFQQFRELLQGIEGGALLRMTVEPLSARPFIGRSATDLPSADRAARVGYEEMVRLLCRRRQRRVVLVVLWSGPGEERRPHRLEERLASIEAQLGNMGLAARRLRGKELSRALGRAGWGV